MSLPKPDYTKEAYQSVIEEPPPADAPASLGLDEPPIQRPPDAFDDLFDRMLGVGTHAPGYVDFNKMADRSVQQASMLSKPTGTPTRSVAGEAAAGTASGVVSGIESVARSPGVVATAVEQTGKALKPGTPVDPSVAPKNDPVTQYQRNIAGVIQGVGSALREEFSPATQLADEMQSYRETNLLPSSAAQIPYSWRWFVFHGPETIGTMAVAVVPGGLVTDSVRAASVVGGLISAAMEGGGNYKDYVSKLKQRGYSNDQAELLASYGAIGYGLAAGAVEVAPLHIIFKAAPGIKNRVVKAMESALAEGSEEAIQTYLDKITQVTAGIDPQAFEHMSADEIWQAFILAGLAGGGMGLAVPGFDEHAPQEHAQGQLDTADHGAQAAPTEPLSPDAQSKAGSDANPPGVGTIIPTTPQQEAEMDLHEIDAEIQSSGRMTDEQKERVMSQSRRNPEFGKEMARLVRAEDAKATEAAKAAATVEPTPGESVSGQGLFTPDQFQALYDQALDRETAPPQIQPQPAASEATPPAPAADPLLESARRLYPKRPVHVSKLRKDFRIGFQRAQALADILNSEGKTNVQQEVQVAPEAQAPQADQQIQEGNAPPNEVLTPSPQTGGEAPPVVNEAPAVDATAPFVKTLSETGTVEVNGHKISIVEGARGIGWSIKHTEPGASYGVQRGGAGFNVWGKSKALDEAALIIKDALATESPTTTNIDQNEPTPPEEPPAAPEGADLADVAFISEKLAGDDRPWPTIVEARKEVGAQLGIDVQPGTKEAKQIDELIERGVVHRARIIVAQDLARQISPDETYQKLLALYERQPNLSVRTSTSMSQQAYSTPAPLAFIASELAGIAPGKTVYEPTAGNGMLLIGADREHVSANELNPDRATSLKAFGFTTTSFDAAEVGAQTADTDVVIANPPFGTVKEKDGSNRVFDTGFTDTTQIDHAISIEALKQMKDDGSAVLILGSKQGDEASRTSKYRAHQTASFYKQLYDTYNVVDHFTVDGDLYRKQGAGYPVDVVVIRGRGKSALALPGVKPPRIYDSWESLGSVLDEAQKYAGVRPQVTGQSGVAGDQGAGGTNQSPIVSQPVGNSGAGNGGVRGRSPRPARRPQPVSGSGKTTNAGDGGNAGGAGGGQSGGPVVGSGVAGGGEAGSGQRPGVRSGGDNAGGLDSGDGTGGPSVKPGYGDSNKVITKEAYADLLKRFRDKTGGSQVNVGFDPEIASITMQLAAYHIEAGARSFADFVRAMVEAAGDVVIPYLKSAYSAARDMPGMEDVAGQMESISDVTPSDIQKMVADFRKPAAPRERKAGDIETSFQTSYTPKSNAGAIGTLIPRTMADSTQHALDAIESEVGDLDHYVATELGMDPATIAKESGGPFSAEQVDAIAMAIYNTKNGAGFIIGDQTGVGKGRVVAAMIMWAKKNDMVPIFVTQNNALYGDIVRDLVDIGNGGFNLIPTDDLSGQKALDLPDGRKLTSAATAEGRRQIIENAAASWFGGKGLVSGGIEYGAIATTYSQMQTVAGNEPWRRELFRRLAPDSFFIFDESHEAGGTANTGFQTASPIQNRSEFVRSLVDTAGGVMYSSATYAKTPEVMDLYRATDMKLAVDKLDSLATSIRMGGIPMQQMIASMLAKAGQYVRRERSFHGVEIKDQVVETDKAFADRMSRIFRGISAFDRLKEKAVEIIKDDEAGSGGNIMNDTATGPAGVTSTNFTSLMHNVVSQMLLAMKVQPIIEHVQAQLDAGEKVVIALSNTMESLIDTVVDRSGANVGDNINVSFRDAMMRYLERSRTLTVKPAGAARGVVEHRWIQDHELPPEALAAYKAAEQMINESGLDTVPGSPIDYLKHQISQLRPRPGKTSLGVGEITGRTRILEYGPDGSTVLRERPAEARGTAGRIATIKAFNDGDIDVIILNRAGSTGVSLHASPKFADTAPRHMLIVQPDRNIDVFMQMMGRIHRTGQVELPRYTLFMSDMPLELRPAGVLMKKLASLNANVTASRAGAFAFDVPDIFNIVGDEVAGQVLGGDHELQNTLDLNVVEPDINNPGKAVAQLTGRSALLSPDGQRELWATLTEAFNSRMGELKAAGENPLEAENKDLQVIPLGRVEAVPKKDAPHATPFADPAYIERAITKSDHLPFKTEEVKTMVAESLGTRATSFNALSNLRGAWSRRVQDDSRDGVQAYRAQQVARAATPDSADSIGKQIDSQYNDFYNFIEQFQPGSAVNVFRRRIGTDYDPTGPAVITKIEHTGGTKNPVAGSSWKVTLAFPDSRRSAKLSMSSVNNAAFRLEASVNTAHVYGQFDEGQSKTRETRHILTGNLLSAHEFANHSGQVVNYSNMNGAVTPGILMPRGWEPSIKTLRGASVNFTKPANVMAFISDGFTAVDDYGLLEVQAVPAGVQFLAPSSRRTGAQYFLNNAALEAAGDEFVRASGKMRMTVPAGVGERVIKAYMDSGVGFTHQAIDTAAKAAAKIQKSEVTLVGDMATDLNNQEKATREKQGGKYIQDIISHLDEHGTDKTKGSVLQRIRDKALKNIEDIKGDQSVTLGSGLGGAQKHLALIANRTIVLAIDAIEAGIKGTKLLTKYIRNRLATETPQFLPYAESIVHEAKRIAMVGDDEAKVEQLAKSVFERMTTELAPFNAAKAAEKITGDKLVAPTAEAAITTPEVLRANLKSHDRAARKAYREGVAKVTEAIPAIRAEIRQKAKDKTANVDEIKSQIRELVQKHIPPEKQGKFLVDVEKATTPEAVDRAAGKMRLVASEFRYKSLRAAFVNRIGNIRKKKMLRRLTEDRRDEARQIINDTIASMYDGKTKDGRNKPKNFTQKKMADTVDLIREAADDIEAAYRRIGEIFAEQAAESKKFKADKVRTIAGHIDQTVANVHTTKSLTGRDNVMEDLEVNGAVRWWRGMQDVDNLTRKVEKLWNGTGVLHNLIHKRMKAQEELYNTQLRDSWKWLDMQVQAAGYKNISEALVATSGTLGESNVERIRVKIGGQDVDLTVGEAASIAAMDDQTLAAIAEGSPIQLDTGRQRTPMVITTDEINAIKSQLGPRFEKLIGQMKLYLEHNIRPALFDVHRRLKGWEPDLVPGYWPRVRNMDASPDVGLAAGWGGMLQRYLENAGILQHRTGGTSPIVVKDLLSTFETHVDHALRIIHMAEATRDATSVLHSQPVVTAINSRFGARMNEMLQNHLLAASMVNRDSVAGPDKLLRHLNSNMVASFLTLNEGTYLRQLGGLFKLWSHMDSRDFLAGMVGMKPGSIQEMKENSGFIWARYQGDSYSRFSPVRGANSVDALDGAGFSQSARGLINAASSLDAKGVGASWDRLIRSIKLMDWFDAIVARVAWEGYKSKATREHSDWKPDQILAYASEQTAEAIRSTQNTTSALDGTTFATETRNSPLRFFLLFTTDPMKSHNMIVRAMHQGPKQGAKAVAGVASNILWSSLVTGGLAYLYSALGAALGGDDDEERDAKRRAEAVDRGLWNLASEALNTFPGYGGGALANAIQAIAKPYMRDGLASPPLMQTIATGFSGASQAGGGLFKMANADDDVSDEEWDRYTSSFLKGLTSLAESGNTLVGNPLLMPYYRLKKIYTGATADYDKMDAARAKKAKRHSHKEAMTP